TTRTRCARSPSCSPPTSACASGAPSISESPKAREASPAMHALELDNVTKSFGSTEVLAGIDLRVAPGEFVVVVGPSGCGKSTLLRIIAGLEEHSSGHVRIGGVTVDAVPPARRGIGMVFQSYALYPHLNVADNMSLALRREGVPKDEIRKRLEAASSMLALGTL